MEMKLQPFDFSRALAKAGMAPDGTRRTPAPGMTSGVDKPAQSGDGFQGAMTHALRSVSAAQNEAQAMQREFQLGNSSVSLEETMISMQKAQLGFQAALSVRNRFVQAYTEVMNMQV